MNGIIRMLVRFLHILIDFMALMMILCLFFIAGYAFWDASQVYAAADATQYEIYKPQTDDGFDSFDRLSEINSDLIAWLNIYGTHIDYPVMQSVDNNKYLDTNAYGDYSISGSIFLDYRNHGDFSDFNSIIYGHHMEKETMFGELDLFSDESYFENHPYGNLFYGDRNYKLEIFAFVHTDAYDMDVFIPNIEGQTSREVYLNNLLETALLKRDVGVTVEDNIVLLSTCSSASTNGRDVLIARILDDELHAMPFLDGEDTTTGIMPVTEPESENNVIKVWGIVCVGLVVLFIFICLCIRRHKKK